MNITCKAFMLKEWTLLDDKIIIGKKEILLSSISRAKHDRIKPGQANGVIQVFYGDGCAFATLAYPKKQREDGEKAAAFILAMVEGVDADERVKERERIQKEG